MRREESGELAAFARFPFLCLWRSQKCKGDKDFLVLPVLQQGSRTKQSGFWLTHVLRFPLSETHSLWVLAGFLFVIWSCFLQVFFMIFLVLYVHVFCPNQISAHWQNDRFFPVWFLTWNSSKSTFFFASLTFSLPRQWKYEHWLISLFVPPSSSRVYGPGSSSRKYLTGPAVCEAVPCVSDKRQSLYGMRLCIFLSEEGFCLKRLRALSVKTFLNPAITSTMLDYIGSYQLQCHLDSLTNMV